MSLYGKIFTYSDLVDYDVNAIVGFRLGGELNIYQAKANPDLGMGLRVQDSDLRRRYLEERY